MARIYRVGSHRFNTDYDSIVSMGLVVDTLQPNYFIPFICCSEKTLVQDIPMTVLHIRNLPKKKLTGPKLDSWINKPIFWEDVLKEQYEEWSKLYTLDDIFDEEGDWDISYRGHNVSGQELKDTFSDFLKVIVEECYDDIEKA